MSNFDRCIIVLAPLYATIDKLSKKQRYPALGLNRKNFNVMPGRQRDIGRPVNDRVGRFLSKKESTTRTTPLFHVEVCLQSRSACTTTRICDSERDEHPDI